MQGYLFVCLWCLCFLYYYETRLFICLCFMIVIIIYIYSYVIIYVFIHLHINILKPSHCLNSIQRQVFCINFSRRIQISELKSHARLFICLLMMSFLKSQARLFICLFFLLFIYFLWILGGCACYTAHKCLANSPLAQLRPAYTCSHLAQLTTALRSTVALAENNILREA